MSDRNPYSVDIIIRTQEKSELFTEGRGHSSDINDFFGYNSSQKIIEHKMFVSLTFEELGILKRCLKKMADKRAEEIAQERKRNKS